MCLGIPEADLEVLPPNSMVIHLGDGSDPNGTSLVEGATLELIGRIFWEDGLSAELEPESFTWESSDTSVATVSIVGYRAVVAGVAAGTATITAIYSGYEDIRDTFDLTVVP